MNGVLILEVPSIIILGHSQCGGIKFYSEIKNIDTNELNLICKMKTLKSCFSKKIVFKDVKATVKYLEKAALIRIT